MCRQYKSYGYGGGLALGSRGREYAYLHEEEPPSGPLDLDRAGGDKVLRPDSGGDGPKPNGDGVPFVSLNDIGDHSGSFHPSGSGRLKPVHAKARSIDIDTKTDNELDNEDVTTNRPEHEEPDDDNAALDDTFAATVVEVDADDYVNNTELYKLLSQRSGSVLEKRSADE